MSLRLCTVAAGVATVSAFGGSKVSSEECIVGPDAAIAPDCEAALTQSPADVTEGSQGLRDPTGTLIHDYEEAGLCQVNVHWHLGAEHRSAGQYDVDGDEFLANTYVGKADNGQHRRMLGGKAVPGFMCRGYDAKDPKYTKPYDWKYCKDMRVGLTYEIHWPFSSAGHCGRLSDGLGGVFCHSHAPNGIGVQGQVFTVVNDDAYDVADLAHGMDLTLAKHVSKYTGSTTGPKYNNDVCSPYAPISWHVDRDCHLVSAKSFDNLCKYMKEEHGMSGDIEAHGSRELVADAWVTSRVMGQH